MNIFFIHFGRCGSTVLMDCLRQQDKYNIHGEIFSGGTAMYDGFERSPWADKKGNGIFEHVDDMVNYNC